VLLLLLLLLLLPLLIDAVEELDVEEEAEEEEEEEEEAEGEEEGEEVGVLFVVLLEKEVRDVFGGGVTFISSSGHIHSGMLHVQIFWGFLGSGC